MTKPGDKFFVKGQGRRPDRTYTVIEVRSMWDIRCSVEPPLAERTPQLRHAMVSQQYLDRAQKL